MKLKKYDFRFYLALIVLVPWCLRDMDWENPTTSQIAWSVFSIVAYFCIFTAVNFPFLSFKIDDSGIDIFQLKRYVCRYTWDEIKTVGTICGQSIYIYVSTETIEGMERMVAEDRLTYGGYTRHVMNSVIWIKGGKKVAEKYGKTILIIDLASGKKADILLNKVIAQNKKYLNSHAGTPVNVYRFPHW